MKKAAKTYSPAPIAPLWPSHGFWGFCRYEIRRGLMLRYWITLPAMWRREQAFRRDLADCLATDHQRGTPAP